jgi:glycosyltransferase involved in cell wall biosynthesis
MGQYIWNLVRCLPAAAPDIEFLLLVDRTLSADLVPSGCRQVVIREPRAAASQSASGLGAQLLSFYWMNARVPSVLRREGVDLFHAANVAVPLFGRSPCVVTIPDMVSVRVPGTFSRFYELYRGAIVPAAARRATRVVAISESTKRDIVELIGVAPEKITTILLGVEKSFAPVTDALELSRVRKWLDLPDRFILHVGAVEKQKRLEPMLRAAAHVLRRGLVDGIVLAGEEGRGALDVRRAVADLGIAERVKFLGYVAQETVPALYTLAQCTVYPSWYEGFGMPVLEAMACGSPVITSNVSSLPEVAGDAGLLVPPGDSDAIACALERILTDDGLRHDLARRGLARAGQFSWEACAAQHVDVYRAVLNAES